MIAQGFKNLEANIKFTIKLTFVATSLYDKFKLIMRELLKNYSLKCNLFIIKKYFSLQALTLYYMIILTKIFSNSSFYIRAIEY